MADRPQEISLASGRTKTPGTPRTPKTGQMLGAKRCPCTRQSQARSAFNAPSWVSWVSRVSWPRLWSREAAKRLPRPPARAIHFQPLPVDGPPARNFIFQWADQDTQDTQDTQDVASHAAAPGHWLDRRHWDNGRLARCVDCTWAANGTRKMRVLPVSHQPQRTKGAALLPRPSCVPLAFAFGYLSAA